MENYREQVIKSLRDKTFHAYPEQPVPFEEKMVFRTLDDAAYGAEIFSFNTEENWRLKLDIRYQNPRDGKKPLMIVLRNPDEQRWDSEAFISDLNNEWNIAYLEVRGIGEFGWTPELQWHVRRSSAWIGRTIASMRVYDLLRAMEFAGKLPDVDPDQIGIAGRGEMASIALFSALLHGKCKTLIIQNLPGSLDVPSNPDGRGAALEMLNVLQITDVNQIPALIYPVKTYIFGDVPKTYHWSMNTLKKLELTDQMIMVNNLEEVK